MRRSRRVARNALFSVVQVAVNGGLYLVLYRFLLDTVGVAQLGVWSVVLAWTSVNNVASLGLGGSTTYFLPKYLARGERAYVATLAQTATLTGAGAMAVGLSLFYPFVGHVLGWVIDDPALLPLALSIVPYAFVSMWTSTTAGLVYASLDGFQRVDLRNVVLVVGGLVFLGGAWVLVPSWGLVGLAQAQLLQAVTVLSMSWVMLRRLLPELPWLPWRWSRAAFREMIGYSLRYQMISITLMLFEPLTKSLMAALGGVSAAGYFEMANRLALQLRAFVVTAHTAVVPTLTEMVERTPERLRGIYEASARLVAALVLVGTPLLVAVTPFVSVLWIGRYEPTFVLFASLLFVGWFGNLVGNPAYVDFLGTGRLPWVVRGHLLVALLNGVLGVGFGLVAAGTGVVVGFVVALLAGSLFMTWAYHRDHGVPLTIWLTRENLLLLGTALAGALLVRALYQTDTVPLGIAGQIAASLVLYAAAVALPLWRHPARHVIAGWVQHRASASTTA